MADKSKIEWTDATWNPIRGCSRVSEGCRHCYAEAVAGRFRGPGLAYEGLTQITNGRPVWNGTIQFVEEHLLDPLKWKRPRRIFVNSMSDLFHENVTDVMRDRIFAVMALAPQHTFQVLTKRPERMLAYLNAHNADIVIWARMSDHNIGLGCARSSWPLPNVWLGVSVENQRAADERIPLLLQTPAALRFLSLEPLLGPVNLRSLALPAHNDFAVHECSIDALSFLIDGRSGLGWAICGGESRPGARPMHPDWARALRDQCIAAGVPFFFKQWGEWASHPKPEDYWLEKARAAVNWHEWSDGIWSHQFGKKAAGHLLDGQEWHQFPELAT